MDGSLASPEVRAGWQSVGPGTRKKGVKYNVDPNLIIDVGLCTGCASVRPVRARKAPVRLNEKDSYLKKTKLNS